jgi:hypothetical protein
MVHVVPNEYPIGAFEAPIDFHSLWNELLEDAHNEPGCLAGGRLPPYISVKGFVLDGDPAARIVQVALISKRRNIQCAVDLGPQSRTARAWAAEFAASTNRALRVVHLLPSLEAGQARYFDAAFRPLCTIQPRRKSSLFWKAPAAAPTS